MTSRNSLTLLASAAWVLSAATPAAAADPSGTWLTKDGDQIRIAPCGAAYCGSIAGLKQPNDPATGRPLTDKNNPDASRRSRPLVGVQVLINMAPKGADNWAGQLYLTDDGKTYNVSMQSQGAASLKVEVCAGVFCQSENWKKIN